jgi:hypothetical protein
VVISGGTHLAARSIVSLAGLILPKERYIE